VHPCCFVASRKTADSVCDQKVMFHAGLQQEETVAATLADAVYTKDALSQFMVNAYC
jgi:hypothetical protein